MKLKKLTIEGFRGVPKTFELELGSKSLCLLGENGRGKSTIVDALEYWSAGVLDGFRGEHYKLDATINLDHGGPAVITCERQGHPTLRRRLAGKRAELAELVGPGPIDSQPPPPLPILRHRTMAEFMGRPPGQKKRALMELLGLEAVQGFRDELVKAANAATKDAEAADRRVAEETAAVARVSDGESLLARAERLRQQAGLADALTTVANLLQLQPSDIASVGAAVNRGELVERAIRACSELDVAVIDRWNGVVADRSVTEAAALHELVSVGSRVLQTWPEDRCPLCLADQDREHLDGDLTVRAAQLAAQKQELDQARLDLAAQITATRELASALEALVGAAPAGRWPAESELVAARRAAVQHAEQVDAALASTCPAPAVPPELAAVALHDLDQRAIALREAAVAEPESPAAAARTQLERLRLAAERQAEAQQVATAERRAAEAISALRDLAEAKVEDAVRHAIGRLSATAANYYGRLVLNPVYSDVKLRYDTARSGGIEFEITYNRQHAVTPPQRVVSESQLNALGLAFFLAQLQTDSTPWRTLLLDDVVNSFDADHRMGLARLLSEEFAGWQVLLFTHDNTFSRMASQFFKGWRFKHIVAWNPTDGPILDDADPLERLRTRLDAGESATDLGGMARLALEQRLSDPLERLGLPIRYSRRQLHSAPEYVDALLSGFAARKSTLAELPVLQRMKGASYLVNIGAHDRPADPMLSTADLRQMVADLDELKDALTCSKCDKPVWSTQRSYDRYQCGCSELAV